MLPPTTRAALGHPNDSQDARFRELPHFEIGQTYRRQEEITGKFGGSRQSGIAPSRTTPAIFIFTGNTGEQYGYTDHFNESGDLFYTGEGQLGDMTMTRGNRAIAEHAARGRALHVFEATGKGKPCVYKGEFFYESHSVKRGLDRDNKERNVIVFRLAPVAKTLQSELYGATEEEGSGGSEMLASVETDITKLRSAAIAACQPRQTSLDVRDITRAVYQRSVQVKRYVLARARGRCELCREPAPFIRKSDETPYLEPHHINRVSDGGLDHPMYVGAVCPTCHRLIHFGVDGHRRNEELRANVIAAEVSVLAA